MLALTLLPAASPEPAQAHHAGSAPGPVNAQSTFKWGRPLWQDDFEGARTKKLWRLGGRGNVRNQHGMLTLNTARRGSTRATLDRRGYRTGRWEIRLRSHRYSTARTDYRVRTELIPAGNRRQHCGARNISLEDHRTGGARTDLAIRTLPDRRFSAHRRLDLRNDRWHTFAVEVTRRRISWFVDAHVITTERRSGALSGVPLTVRFTMQARPGARMNQSRMQMDWLRYFDLHRPDAKSVRAPRARKGTYAGAC